MAWNRERNPKRARRGIARIGAALAIALVGASAEPAFGAAITVDAERRDDTIAIRASAVLASDAQTAWRVLTDYARYPEFIPDLRSSRVVARQGHVVTVEQAGDATLWLFRMPLAITFEIRESPPDVLHSRAVAGSLRALASDYAITRAASGVRLDYTGRVAPGFELFGYLEQIAVQRNVARQFQALVDEIERQSAARAVPSAAGAR